MYIKSVCSFKQRTNKKGLDKKNTGSTGAVASTVSKFVMCGIDFTTLS